MSETTSIGQSIHRSIKLIAQAGQGIDSLSELIKQELANNLPGHLKTMDNWAYSEQEGSNGWTWNFLQYSLPVKAKSSKSRGAEAYLHFQISLDGDGMTHSETNNEEPLIHISFWEKSWEPGTECYFCLWMDSNEEVKLQDQVLFTWPPVETTAIEQNWTYSLKLTTLNSLTDIKEKIVGPVNALLNNPPALDAGLPDIEGIVRYVRVEGTEDKVFSPIKQPE